MSALNSTSIDVHVSLVRLGTFKRESKTPDKSKKKLHFKSFSRATSSDQDILENADEIRSTQITVSSRDSKEASARFELTIPCNLPPTTNFPIFEISYALVATSTLPWGQVLRTTHTIRISRRPVEQVPVQPTPTAYSHSPLALCVSFQAPSPRSNELSAVLHLRNTSTTTTTTEEQRLISGSLEWTIEEVATITTPNPDAIPLTTSLRTIDKGTCVYGQPPPPLPPPSQQQQSRTDNKAIVDVPFTITIPNDTEFPNPVKADKCLLHAWSPKYRRWQKMGFEFKVEQMLRIGLHLDQNTRLLERGEVAQEVYSTVLPLKGLQNNATGGEGEEHVARKYCITREVV